MPRSQAKINVILTSPYSCVFVCALCSCALPCDLFVFFFARACVCVASVQWEFDDCGMCFTRSVLTECARTQCSYIFCTIVLPCPVLFQFTKLYTSSRYFVYASMHAQACVVVMCFSQNACERAHVHVLGRVPLCSEISQMDAATHNGIENALACCWEW